MATSYEHDILRLNGEHDLQIKDVMNTRSKEGWEVVSLSESVNGFGHTGRLLVLRRPSES